ncbi:MAG: DNA/RNA helicase domain-containing protein, partial [Finegoldia magna]|nr:DNA/RNA helicase domain-containing protein [Finegoldia magna]
VFLSGNFPLVEVLQEALVRDKLKKMKELNEKVNKSEVKRNTNAFIQIIHKYRDFYINNNNIPPEHVVIYDEAQRSWNSEKIADFMKNKNGIANFNYSEPEFLISTLDRHKDWAVIICLIGGGQEINDGEAGLPEWFKALRERFNYWDVYVSNNLKERIKKLN